MRRSAAPSQVNPAKRPRFSAPFKTPVVNTLSVSIHEENKSEEDINLQPRTSAVVTTEKVVRNDGTKSTYISPLQSKVKANSSSSCLSKLNDTNEIVIKDTESTNSHSDGSTSRYLSVMWCKSSKKKHKKWEGDAVLVTSGRNATLYDTEGKVIGKGTGYKSTELETLKEDETLFVGGKEIQVMGVLTHDEFQSGKCFTIAAPTVSPCVSERGKIQTKQFVNPQKPNSVNVTNPGTPAVIRPRYNPDAPGALILPRPNAVHQWKYNKKNLNVIDVVVDPYLSVHLRPHQREGVIFLYECVMGLREYNGTGAILADDMGLGKTLQCIALLWTLNKQGPYGGKPEVKRSLIITPGSLVKNWSQEFKKWLGTERIPVYAVSSDKKVQDFVNTAVYPVLIISYEMFVRAYDIIQNLNFDLVICDEGHRLKNTAIKTTSLIMSLPTRRRIILTGTPIQNDLQEFYSIVEFCNPGLLGTSPAFRRVFEAPIIASRQPQATPQEVELGEERGAELARLIKLFTLRRTQEINNQYLPPKCEIVLFCRPAPLQLKLYRQLLCSHIFKSCLAGKLEGASHLICIGALKKLCNHPSLIFDKVIEASECSENFEEDSVYSGLHPLYPAGFTAANFELIHCGKLAVLSSLLYQCQNSISQEKIVLVSNHTKTLDMLQMFCNAAGYQTLRLDGQTPTSRRHEIVTRFNSKHASENIFLLSSKAGGVGLNLIGASRLLLYDIDWNPANDLQAMARVWRDGQKRVVYIYRLLTTGTIEEKIYQRQISKQGLSGAVMDAKAKNDVQFSVEDLKDLFSLNESTKCDTHELINCTCNINTEDQTVGPNQETTAVRSCQLGHPTKQKKKNLGMDELMEWKHLQGNAVSLYKDWFLADAQDDISYCFWHETKS